MWFISSQWQEIKYLVIDPSDTIGFDTNLLESLTLYVALLRRRC